MFGHSPAFRRTEVVPRERPMRFELSGRETCACAFIKCLTREKRKQSQMDLTWSQQSQGKSSAVNAVHSGCQTQSATVILSGVMTFGNLGKSDFAG